MTADQDIDRSEEPTTFKLQKARDRGQTPRSVDATACAVFLAAVAFLAWQGAAALQALLRLFRSALVQVAGRSADGAGPVFAQLVEGAAGILLPFLLVLVAAGAAAAVAQTGMVFSLQPLQFDFERLNPAAGWKRVFSRRTLFEGARACVKLAVLCCAGVAALLALLPQFHVLATLPAPAFLQAAWSDLVALAWRMAAALALIAAVDMLFTRRDFHRRMRMSRREWKDEYRHREGDPRIRARLRELRRELLQRSLSLRNTRNADFVLTNPTHYAVALEYRHGEMDAPRVIAKGAGQLAAAMREIAARHRIVVVQNPPLARRLFREVPLESSLPADFHAEVARIVVWVLAMRRQRMPQGAVA
ncbi:EscU/YscU/HrcU family type III secretion system export apparatus switch protein [Ramlibacter sp. USB13]|uniref:EscU/YscU/HrcU family type III secretion system export apparatus switch protein n=1 Tax=Ramlibacter cellulosilyticus TaxID=2764187 RepID=A0A923MUQ7_9BURK|nr:EscU/YscU/HrcU family type III secretion system export apparatus switch protein [Ramlibacter cellulosilyticus]MBC5785088.1 EscU/YscU/HrcU family type III secretion system export apparatus switch protein [Ramlibacter cellulosilyticus]